MNEFIMDSLFLFLVNTVKAHNWPSRTKFLPRLITPSGQCYGWYVLSENVLRGLGVELDVVSKLQ